MNTTKLIIDTFENWRLELEHGKQAFSF